MKTLEGDSGVLWRYFEARELMARPKSLKSVKLKLNKLVSDIADLRPRWPDGIILRGDIFAGDKVYDEAAACYREALEQGERLDVYERLIAVLYQDGRYRGGDEYRLQPAQLDSQFTPACRFSLVPSSKVRTESRRRWPTQERPSRQDPTTPLHTSGWRSYCCSTSKKTRRNKFSAMR